MTQAGFKKSQCKIDADCAAYGDGMKCGPRTYRCGKKCEAIQMLCYVPPKPVDPKKAPSAPKPEEPINPYKPVN
jgi:hypothetical protein